MLITPTPIDVASRRKSSLQTTPTQARKLRKLTVVTLSSQNRTLPYALLLSELDLGTVREVEVRSPPPLHPP